MDFKAYLARIGLTDVPPATLEGLYLLQDHHMRHVPFENLNVILRRPLNLSSEALFEKIVKQGRGGYCFELNRLYAELLKVVGFDPIPMMARVWYGRPDATPPRTHLVYRVEVEGETWVTDVGFGGRAARVPLRLNDSDPVDDGDGLIRIQSDAEFGYRVAREIDGAWTAQYTVETSAAPWADILCGNHWTENHPESKFRHSLGVGLFTKEGRTGFYGGTLTRRGLDKQIEVVSDFEAVLTLLRHEFGITVMLTPEESKRLKAVL